MKTLKAVVAKYNQTSLILRILIGLAVGSVLALVAPGAGWVGELGSLFVGALKGIAPVLVFVIVASALAQGSSKLDRRFGTVIWLYNRIDGVCRSFGDALECCILCNDFFQTLFVLGVFDEFQQLTQLCLKPFRFCI